MRVLLDGNLPRELAGLLVDHEVHTIHQRRWSDLNNGALLDAAAPEYDAFVTLDQSLRFQQKSVASARKALEEVTGAALDEPWSLKMGDQVLMTAPRGETARQHLNHLIHHRGQTDGVSAPRRCAVAVGVRPDRRRTLVGGAALRAGRLQRLLVA